MCGEGFGSSDPERKFGYAYCTLHPVDACCQLLNRDFPIGENGLPFTDPNLATSANSRLLSFSIFCGLIALFSWIVGFSVCSNLWGRKSRPQRSASLLTISSDKTLVNVDSFYHHVLRDSSATRTTSLEAV
jgi:hypothetical protein